MTATYQDAPPLACIGCGDTCGPWVPTPNGPLCEDCETAAKATSTTDQ